MRMGFAIAALVLLGSCSPPWYEIVARRDGPATVFDARPAGEWPFRKDDNNVRSAFLVIRDSEHLVWKIEFRDGPGCGKEAQRIFPLIYGRVPRCFAATVPAQALRSESVYTVSAMIGDYGHGLFRHGETIANLDRIEAENATTDWKAIRDEGPGVAVDSNVATTNVTIETPPD